MPVGKIDVSVYFTNLSAGTYATPVGAEEAGAAVIEYGRFSTMVVDFTIVAFVIVLLIRGMNAMRRHTEGPNRPSPRPMTKNRPFRISAIPIQATRRPNRISEMEAPAA